MVTLLAHVLGGGDVRSPPCGERTSYSMSDCCSPMLSAMSGGSVVCARGRGREQPLLRASKRNSEREREREKESDSERESERATESARARERERERERAHERDREGDSESEKKTL